MGGDGDNDAVILPCNRAIPLSPLGGFSWYFVKPLHLSSGSKGGPIFLSCSFSLQVWPSFPKVLRKYGPDSGPDVQTTQRTEC